MFRVPVVYAVFMTLCYTRDNWARAPSSNKDLNIDVAHVWRNSTAVGGWTRTPIGLAMKMRNRNSPCPLKYYHVCFDADGHTVTCSYDFGADRPILAP